MHCNQRVMSVMLRSTKHQPIQQFCNLCVPIVHPRTTFRQNRKEMRGGVIAM